MIKNSFIVRIEIFLLMANVIYLPLGREDKLSSYYTIWMLQATYEVLRRRRAFRNIVPLCVLVAFRPMVQISQ